MATPQMPKHDPRHLRALFDRATSLAPRALGRVRVRRDRGQGGATSLVRDFLEFVESQLRMEDSVFHLLRERSVLLLTDVDRAGAEAIVERLRSEFVASFPTLTDLAIEIAYRDVPAGRAARHRKGRAAAALRRRGQLGGRVAPLRLRADEGRDGATASQRTAKTSARPTKRRLPIPYFDSP